MPAIGERGKGSSDGCWLLEGGNGIGGGGKGFGGANRESTYSNSPVLFVSAPEFSIQVITFSLQLQLIVLDLLSHISLLQHGQLGPPRQVIPRLHFKIIILISHVFRSASW